MMIVGLLEGIVMFAKIKITCFIYINSSLF